MSSIVGKTFTITGQLEKFSRRDAAAKAALLGARFVSETSGKCDFVVLGDKVVVRGGSSTPVKVKQAEKQGIAVIPASKFYHYLASSTTPSPAEMKPHMDRHRAESTVSAPSTPDTTPTTQVVVEEHTPSSISLKDKSIMVMPGLTHMSQIHAMFRLEQVGAFNATRVDKADYVIINPTTGAGHIKAAEKKGVEVLSEDQFYKAIEFTVPGKRKSEESQEVLTIQQESTTATPRISVGNHRSKKSAKSATTKKSNAAGKTASASKKLKKSETTRVYDGVKVAPTGSVTGEEAMAEMSSIPRSMEGKRIFFTGEFATGLLGRTALAHKCGAMVTQHLTSEVDFVVCGTAPSQALLDQAAALEIPVSTEAEFNKKTVAFISEGILLNSLPQVSAEVESQMEKSMLITQAPEPSTSPVNLDFGDGDWNVVPEPPAPEI